MPKYSIKVANRWGETIGVNDCHSLDEAVNHLEKALYRRDLTLGKRRHDAGLEVPADILAKLREAGDIPNPETPSSSLGPAPEPEAPAEAPAAAPEEPPAPPAEAPAEAAPAPAEAVATAETPKEAQEATAGAPESLEAVKKD